jgi:hypothetical protein
MARELTARDLSRELADLSEEHSNLGRDELFVLWYLRAFITDDLDDANTAICGGANDKGIDAVLIDDRAKAISIVQGKYRHEIGKHGESRSDVLAFASLAGLLTGDSKPYNSYTRGMAPKAHKLIDEARERLVRQGYRLQLHFVTTGRCSSRLEDEARRVARSATGEAGIQVVAGQRILLLLSDYLDGVAPPVPELELEIESNARIRSDGLLQRFDQRSEIESWVFSMTGTNVATLFDKAGPRLFARNVRGFLGQTEINRGMEDTIEREPDFFWYYNNGITIVCDHAKQESGGGRQILRVSNPQVINGQQTTRTLFKNRGRVRDVSVLVRVIRIPREEGGKGDAARRFEQLISRIVAATNWQNAIRPSDLMANDRRQIELERGLRKFGYWYLRKRQTKSEARRSAAARYALVKKEEIAQAVAACELDPSVVRTEGKEALFEERLYRHTFPTSDPLYYLVRYRLMREVNYAARGRPERAYAKWVVLNFVWGRLAPLIRGRSMQAAFVKACERNTYPHPLAPLYQANDAAFKAAIRFYRRKRAGQGEKAPDVSNFFRRRGLDKAFSSFWSSPSNPAKRAFRRQWRRFEERLTQYAAQ